MLEQVETDLLSLLHETPSMEAEDLTSDEIEDRKPDEAKETTADDAEDLIPEEAKDFKLDEAKDLTPGVSA